MTINKAKTNCPNCGAVMTDDSCKFCGTIMYDFACIDIDKPFYMKIKHDDRIFRVKARLTNCELNKSSNAENSYYDNRSYCLMRAHESLSIHMDFDVLKDGNILALELEPNKIPNDIKPY